MKFTRDPEMPEPLFKALVDSSRRYKEELSEFLCEHSKEGVFNISVTTLNKSPRQAQLGARHWKHIVKDPLDLWFSFKGSIIHYVLELYSPSHWVRELRLATTKVYGDEKVMIHGQFDAYDPHDKTLWDWKFVSGISVRYPKPEHKVQLNILAHIMEKNNKKVNTLKNCYLIERLDNRYEKDPFYPKKEFKIQEHGFMPKEEVEEHIKTRALIHLNEINTPDKNLPLCTDDERWVHGTSFSIYKRKKGTKKEPHQDFSSRALGHFDSEIQARNFLDEFPQTEETKIVEKAGYPTACDYCDVRDFCNQRQKELAEES
jgi:hypothetical protein